MTLTLDPLNPGTYGNVSIFNSSTGGSGSTYSIFGASTDYTWAVPTTTQTGAKIHVQGDAVFEGNITWQDRDMREWFESVESRLAILHPNPELEAEWSELAELRMRYVELERELLEKQRVFDILKKS
jgi:hypothetical protein